MGLEILVNNETAKLSINWEKMGPYSGASAWVNEVQEYNITNFSEKIKSGFVGENGQDPVSTILFYLMEDGTVEYTKVIVDKQDNSGNHYLVMNYTYDKNADGRIIGQHFESQGKINGVKDIIKFYTVTVYREPVGSYLTTIGATKDGSFYDLGYEVQKLSN